MSLKNAGVTQISFEGRGDRIARDFYIPVLKNSVAYDRATGYFSVEALVHAASGVSGLISNGGRMRLILGAHDVPKELWEAYRMGIISGRDVVENIGKRIAEGLEKIEDALVKRRLETIAWMFNQRLLEVKVVLPRHLYLGQTGIFHYKILVFKDREGNIIAAEGSANETEPAYTVNGERLVVFYSWRSDDKERVEDLVRCFERLWNDENPDFEVYNLPEAVYRSIVKFSDSPKNGNGDGNKGYLRGLLPACRFIRILPRVRCLAHMGLGPVRLFPHQVRAVNLARERYPFRVLFADEVGLGKTIEAGAVVKLLWITGYVRRVLVLAPKNVTRQWWDELRGKFGLPAYLLKPGRPNTFVAPDGKEFPVYGNPFDVVDLIVASWHYVRGRKGSEPELFKAKGFDLVLIDEAHAARITRSEFSSPRPTRLYELATAISSLTPHVFLLTATPLQLNELEMLDLLRILGLGGPWVHEDFFKRYYLALNKPPNERTLDEWIHLFELISWFARTYLEERHRESVVKAYFGTEEARELLYFINEGNVDGFRSFLKRSNFEKIDRMDRVMRGLMPTSWFMIRNTRERLKKEGYRFPERIIDNVDVVLNEEQSTLLSELDDYLANYYNEYMRFLSGDERFGFGLIRSIYHQRFVSSFASAYNTIRRRRESLEALLEGDEKRLRELAEDMLEDIGEEFDEDELLDMMRAAVERARDLVEKELDRLKTLEVKLLPYSRAMSAINDPKLREIRKVVERLRGEGRKVLIFSKFTDTVDIIRDFLSQWLGPEKIGTYTGRGGEIWDQEQRRWVVCEKERVSRSLQEDVDVLVCSDAASEGLNLQAASAVMNVDMPWNPAKVEQRIGRVDRIGQKADVVRVINVWYPETYEAKMYKVLFERHNIWWIIIGPASGIIAERLQDMFEKGLRGLDLQKRIMEIAEEVEKAKDEAVKLSKIFPEDLPLKPTFVEAEVTRVLERFVEIGCRALGMKLIRRDNYLFVEPLDRLPERVRVFVEKGLSIEPGGPDALVPGHPFVQWLASELEMSADPPERVPFSLYSVGGEDGLLDVYVVEPEGKPEHIGDVERIVDLTNRLIELAQGGA
ncbi:MAG: helicase-related protein [Syntrophobacterales bacterium]|nr:helicase-related protein [Syntrophobacterales bacterium]